MAADRGARWITRAGALRVALAGALCAWPALPPLAADACPNLVATRSWDLILQSCQHERWRPHRDLAAAWLALDDGRAEAALQGAERLLSSAVAADAAYLAGYLRGQSEAPPEQQLARTRFEQALRGYQRAHRAAEASAAASFLARLPHPQYPFDDSLAMAQLAVTEADRSGDARARGRAAATLAEVYDTLGMAEPARAAFLRAEELLQRWPEEAAHVYLKHALFLLDLGDRRPLDAAALLLDAADEQRLRAAQAGRGWRVATLRFAIPLNRAVVHAQRQQLDAADAALGEAERVMREDPQAPAYADQQAKVHLVAGQLAIHRGALHRAEQLFQRAGIVDQVGRLDRRDGVDDYRWRMATQLAQAYRAAGQPARAEQLLGDALAIIERVRRSSAQLELRPWVLSRHRAAHDELLSLLLEQGRAEEALAVAESLHARAWLDAVVQPRGQGGLSSVLAAARVRARLATAAAPPPSAATLMRALDDREALVFVSVGDTPWRAHLRAGEVRFRRLPATTLEVLRRFSVQPDDPALRVAASQHLLPAELEPSHAPLYIVANGWLADVPFAALQLGGRPLVATRPLAHLPGLAALRCADRTWEPRAVVLGDSRGDLPDAAREATLLASRLGTQPHLAATATRRALLSARRAEVLHLAVHGLATDRGRSLLLADHELTAAEVIEEDLAPRLAMLSGCATATSDSPESWGGFPSAFLAAGSRYVIATQRTVRDDEAARLVEAYYAQPDALDPIARLAAAQTALAATHPSSTWAYFAAWGNPGCENQTAAVTSPAPAPP